MKLECYWRVINGQSGREPLIRFALVWQLQTSGCVVGRLTCAPIPHLVGISVEL